jgi:hypothetical protein
VALIDQKGLKIFFNRELINDYVSELFILEQNESLLYTLMSVYTLLTLLLPIRSTWL